ATRTGGFRPEVRRPHAYCGYRGERAEGANRRSAGLLENLRADLRERHGFTLCPRVCVRTVAERCAGGIHDALLVDHQYADLAREIPIEVQIGATRQSAEQPECASMFTTRAQ